jgi:hypothetical protein
VLVPQRVLPVAQPHLLFVQTCEVGHLALQALQWLTLFVVLTQDVPQRVVPVGQAQVPF